MAVTKVDITRQGQFSGDTSIQSHKLTNVTDPTSAQDAATKAYADSLVAGLSWKAAVRAATTANGTLATAYANGQIIDGVTLVTGDRILIKNQTTQTENGLYIVAASGAPSRSPDANTNTNFVDNLAVFVEEGTTQADTAWTVTNNGAIILGTTNIVFAQFAGTGGTGTVTTVSVVSANGFAGSVANASTTPAITVTTTVAAGLVKSTGTALAAASAGSDYMAPGNFITRETPSGTINGSNTAFTLANTPISGSEQVFLNGILQEPGAGNDYTISGVTITYLTAPITGDRLRVTYQK